MSFSEPMPRQASELGFLDQLRTVYAEKGFTFVINPGREELPDFLGSYRPDAVARKPGTNIAIEIKQHFTAGSSPSLQQIHSLFDGHPEWRLVIAHAGGGSAKTTIARAEPSLIRARLSEVSALASNGHPNAAFVLAWSLLEAVAHTVSNDASGPQNPGTALQTLAMLGYVEPEAEERIRALIDLRNKVVHGDLSVEPAAEQIDLLLSVIADALAEYASTHAPDA